MIIKGYGIELERLTKADIELVRYWRNSERINRFMEFRGYITPEMQEAWFHSIDTPENNYFIIRYNGEKVGLIHGSQLDWKEYVTRNGGIFIWDESLWNTLVPLSAAFLLTEISFIFGMKKTYAKILRSNTNSIAFNRQLGYVLAEGQETQENQQYVLTPEAFYEKT